MISLNKFGIFLICLAMYCFINSANAAHIDFSLERVQTADLDLPADLVRDLNTQELIQDEAKYKFKEVADSKVMEELPESSITRRILEYFYERHPHIKG